MMGFKNYLKKNLSLLKKAIKKKNVISSVSSDATIVVAFLLLFFTLLLPVHGLVQDMEDALVGFQPDDISPELMDYAQAMIIKASVFIASFLILMSMIAFFSRLFLWRYLSNVKSASESKKMKVRRYLKYYFSSLMILISMMLVPILLLIINITQLQNLAQNPERMMALSLVILLFIVLYVHLSMVFTKVFAITSKTFYSLGKAFSVGLGEVQYFLLPYLIIVLSVYVIDFLLRGLLTFIPPELSLAFYAILVFALLTISRLFFSRLIGVLYKKSTKYD